MSAGFFVADVRAQLGERRVWLAAVLFAYAVAAAPFVVAHPPPHVKEALATWFGDGDAGTLFLFVWVDVAMNKVVAMLGVVLGAGLVVRERETRLLDLLWSKPVTRARYYVVRVAAAAVVMALLYAVSHAVAVPYFTARVEGFSARAFVASACVHALAATFAVTASAAVAVWVRRRTVAAIVSLLGLFVLVSFAFVGAYNPAWQAVAQWNPFAQGASVVAHARDLSVARHVLAPMGLLALANAAAVAVGVAGVRRWEV